MTGIKKGQNNNRKHASRLRKVIDTCQLMDLGYQGTKFTWSNGRVGAAHIKERIDRVLGNKQ